MKRVNDNQGHEFGNRLIITAAKIIESSFGAYGKSYRVGGDEFVVVMEGKALEENYKKALPVFQNMIQEENDKGTNTYTIRIAHGFSACEKISAQSVDETITKADSLMYENKAMLKDHQLS